MSAEAALRGRGLASAGHLRTAVAVAAELGLYLAIFWLALSLRLTSLADPTDLSDEGIRGVQLRLRAAGFKPVSEIYASQGPLSLWLFYPAVALFGPTLVVGRLTVVVASLVVMLATALLARRVAGAVAGLAATAILAVSPVFLDNSRLAFVEVPSLAPTLVGLLLVVQFRRSERRLWLVISAVLFAVGALAKPMAAIAGLPAAILLLAPALDGPISLRSVGGRSLRARLTDLALFSVVGLAVCVAVVLAVGPATLYEQVIVYRIGARAIRGWDFWQNASLIAGQLWLNGWGVLLAAGVGAVGVLLDRRALGLAVLAWLVGGIAALLAYSPLWEKHVTYVLPPLAILAGAGFGSIVPLAFRQWDARRLALAAPAVAAVALVASYLPTLESTVRSVVYRHAGDDFNRYSDDLYMVQAATEPGDFAVVDDAYLAMLAGRLTPPFLADLSWNRILARALTADQAIAATRQFGTKALVLQDDHLGQIQRYLTWADREYVLAKAYVQRRPARFRRVYLSPDVDLATVGANYRGTLANQTEVQIGPAALLGYELERRELKSGSRVDLTLMFQALQDRPPEHALILRLHDRNGETAWQSEWKVGDGGQELHTWSAGRWQALTLRLLVDDVPEGAYTLTVGLQRPNGGPAPVTATAGARAWGNVGEVDLGEVRVVR